MRGTVGLGVLHVERQRFIPARAGNSVAVRTTRRTCAVYPRPCGEQSYSLGQMSPTSGLSPPMRGTGPDTTEDAMYERFIPARAGNRSRGHRRFGHTTVYPRPCGEQETGTRAVGLASGLSPPVRGTGLGQGANAVERRFIPARAGNRTSSSVTSPWKSVYPRPCGEQIKAPESFHGEAGLSPPVRGTGRRWPERRKLLRFIPARAGNRPLEIGASTRPPVYPRPCGEQLSRYSPHTSASGLSPPVRGTALRHSAHSCSMRFIPARAGNRL